MPVNWLQMELKWAALNWIWSIFVFNTCPVRCERKTFFRADGYYQVRTTFWHNRWSGALLHVSNRMKRSNLQKRDVFLHIALGDELYYSVWALNCGIDMLPWPNIPSKWADGLGQVHCQYGTFAKLRTSCPCEVEFEVVVFFFEGDWHVHKMAVWECFDIGTWTRRISSHVLAR